jgi:hypothetical protein
MEWKMIKWGGIKIMEKGGGGGEEIRRGRFSM